MSLHMLISPDFHSCHGVVFSKLEGDLWSGGGPQGSCAFKDPHVNPLFFQGHVRASMWAGDWDSMSSAAMQLWVRDPCYRGGSSVSRVHSLVCVSSRCNVNILHRKSHTAEVRL